MSRPLNLPDPVHDALTLAAAAYGTTPVGWIAAHLQVTPVPNSGPAMAAALEELAVTPKRTAIDPTEWQFQQRIDSTLHGRDD